MQLDTRTFISTHYQFGLMHAINTVRTSI